MSAAVRLTPLLGSGVSHGPTCSLLDFDGYKIMLDCGWDESFSVASLTNVINAAKEVRAILITFPDMAHSGALPYLFKHGHLKNCKVYATSPVKKMGMLFAYDTWSSAKRRENFTLYDIRDVDAVFDHFVELTYTQSQILEGSPGIKATPLNAGHMVGGTFWKIEAKGEQVVYMVDYNDRRERHLDQFVFEASGLRPSVLITDSGCSLTKNVPRKISDRLLEEQVMITLNRNGNVLFPCDTAGRVLELLLVLDNLFELNKLTHSLAFLSPVSHKVREYAKTQNEWMGKAVQEANLRSAVNAFDLQHFRMVTTREELDKLPKPVVVVTTNASLELGFSTQLFVDFMHNELNTVIFTIKPQPGSLASLACQDPKPEELDVTVKRSLLLEGAELEAHRIKTRKEREEKNSKEEAERKKIQEAAIKKAAMIEENDNPLHLRRGNSASLSHSLSSAASSSVMIFPFVPRAREWNPYGEIITMDDGPIGKLLAQGGEREEDPVSAPVPIPLSSSTVTNHNVHYTRLGLSEDELNGGDAPRKYVSITRKYRVNCDIVQVLWEGRADSVSMEGILFKANPNKLVFIRGNTNATNTAVKMAEERNICPEVYAPGDGETVELTSGSNIVTVQLTDALTSRLEFKGVQGVEAVYVSADICLGTEGNAVTLEPSKLGGSHRSVLLGDCRLSDLVSHVRSHGITAKLSKGILYCGEKGNVIIRRKTEGNHNHRYVVVGNMSPLLFHVREILYSKFTMF